MDNIINLREDQIVYTKEQKMRAMLKKLKEMKEIERILRENGTVQNNIDESV